MHKLRVYCWEIFKYTYLLININIYVQWINGYFSEVNLTVFQKSLIDLHTHTIASGHAYSTLQENIDQAKKKGLKVLGTSDHYRLIPGTAHPFYFRNFKVIPKEVDGIQLYNGVEANIYDEKGSIDVEDSLIRKIDYVIASLHTLCVENLGIEGNTRALIGAIENPNVNIIGHPNDGHFPIDPDEVAAAAAENHKIIELNNSSLQPTTSKLNGASNMRYILEACRKYKTMIIMGTDSHICYEIGDFEESLAMLQEMDFPEEQVLNFDLNKLTLALLCKK